MYINSVAVPLQWLLTIDLWQVRRGACSASVCARLAGWWQDATRALPLALPLSSQQCSWQSAPAGVRCFVRERADMALADARFTDLGVGRFMRKEADTVEFGDWHHALRDAPLHMWHSKVRATMAGDLTDGRGDALPAITITSPASVPNARPLGAHRPVLRAATNTAVAAGSAVVRRARVLVGTRSERGVAATAPQQFSPRAAAEARRAECATRPGILAGSARCAALSERRGVLNCAVGAAWNLTVHPCRERTEPARRWRQKTCGEKELSKKTR